MPPVAIRNQRTSFPAEHVPLTMPRIALGRKRSNCKGSLMPVKVPDGRIKADEMRGDETASPRPRFTPSRYHSLIPLWILPLSLNDFLIPSTLLPGSFLSESSAGSLFLSFPSSFPSAIESLIYPANQEVINRDGFFPFWGAHSPLRTLALGRLIYDRHSFSPGMRRK